MTGLEKVGKAITSGGRGFYVYKYFVYEEDTSLSLYCRGSYEVMAVFND